MLENLLMCLVDHLPPLSIERAKFSVPSPGAGVSVLLSRALARLVAVNHLQSRGVAGGDQTQGPSSAGSCLYLDRAGGNMKNLQGER